MYSPAQLMCCPNSNNLKVLIDKFKGWNIEISEAHLLRVRVAHSASGIFTTATYKKKRS